MRYNTAMAGQKLVNVGTKEAPVDVPEDVNSGVDSPVNRQWWDMLAIGSVVVPDEVLSNLIGGSTEKTGQANGKKKKVK